ncbi:nondiscriminating glutamyl-tRNA synthetase EARS2, mitochondrial-like [Mytilus galloprovincialis]|uniref:nondiscriminating glutamyl-tRNA synthetase EARS2, mitochondrial-like n=1 Tax=Mytilus galloprovincialis TaxID=29158 RepID=UPI003F7C2362
MVLMKRFYSRFKHFNRWTMLRCFHVSQSVNCVRVRFAPSPTGQLHLGSLRTALYNFLFAKANNGKFILRIEDTDQTRKVSGAVENLCNILQWASVHPDEGPFSGGDCGPYVQSERLYLYQKYIETLLENGTAYKCFCSQKRLDLLKKEALRNRETPRYDGKCRHLSDEERQDKLQQGTPYVVRLKLVQLAEPFEDLIYGPIEIDLTENEGDPVLMKTDNYPTYHFANVVDDYLMKITHVLRGVEWQLSTPKHLMIYQAFGWTPPKYAHLPLIMNNDGTKLSKRQGDIHVEHFMKLGYYSDALLNYITLPGGGFTKGDNEVLKLDELVKNFDISTVKRSSGRLDPAHLDRLNQLFIQRKIADGEMNELTEQIRKIVMSKYSGNISLDDLSNEYLEQIMCWCQNRISRLDELAGSDFEFLWLKPDKIDISNVDIPNPWEVLQSCIECVKNMDTFDESSVGSEMKKNAKRMKVKFAPYMKFLRLCLSGLKEGPSVGEIMTVLGKSKTLERLKHASCICEKKESSRTRTES